MAKNLTPGARVICRQRRNWPAEPGTIVKWHADGSALVHLDPAAPLTRPIPMTFTARQMTAA